VLDIPPAPVRIMIFDVANTDFGMEGVTASPRALIAAIGHVIGAKWAVTALQYGSVEKGFLEAPKPRAPEFRQ
jgi:hypothetical protein